MKANIYLFIFFGLLSSTAYSQADDRVDTLPEKIIKFQQKSDSLNDHLNTKQSPIKFSVGASFDFLSARSKTDLYYDINLIMPEIWQSDPNKYWRNIGLDFSFYQTRLFGDSTVKDLEQAPKAFAALNLDTLLAEKYTLVRQEKTTFENIGLFLSPTYKLRPNLFGILHSEGIIQSTTLYLEDGFTNIDSTLKIAYKDYKEPENTERKIRPGEKKPERQKNFRYFLGLGIMLDLPLSGVNFRLKTIAGYMKSKPWLGNSSGLKDEGFFYNVNIQIIEMNAGFKLGGEVRYRFNEFPYYSIFISKQFSLSKFGEFISK